MIVRGTENRCILNERPIHVTAFGLPWDSSSTLTRNKTDVGLLSWQNCQIALVTGYKMTPLMSSDQIFIAIVIQYDLICNNKRCLYFDLRFYKYFDR